MKVNIIATKSCSHRVNIEREFQVLGIRYQVLFVEEHPDVVTKDGLRHSPYVLVDDQLIFDDQPGQAELRAYFATH